MTVEDLEAMRDSRVLATDILTDCIRKAMLDEASQTVMRRWEMPDEYLGPAEYLAFARERTAYERATVARLNLSID